MPIRPRELSSPLAFTAERSSSERERCRGRQHDGDFGVHRAVYRRAAPPFEKQR